MMMLVIEALYWEAGDLSCVSSSIMSPHIDSKIVNIDSKSYHLFNLASTNLH